MEGEACESRDSGEGGSGAEDGEHAIEGEGKGAGRCGKV